MSQPPRQIGHYEIDCEIGRRGMGIVYKAYDPKLGREVALKVLAEEVAADPSRIARFREEARTLATLNHPDILTVRDVDTEGAIGYVVAELLEGHTLTEELRHSRLAWRGLRRSAPPSPTAWPPRTRAGSCIATSSRTTSSLPTTA